MMKCQILITIAVFVLIETTAAGSIYRCTNDKEQVIFTDKPCGKMKGKLIHQSTEKDLKAMPLKRKIAKINRLIHLDNIDLAQRYAKKHQLENVYKEGIDAYNQSLDRKIKQQQLASQKKADVIKQQQLLIQQQALKLQKQQLEQQKQQLKADKALAASKKKYRHYYPYQRYSPIKPCIGSPLNCQQQINNKYKTNSYRQVKPTQPFKKTPNVGYILQQNQDENRTPSR